MGKRFVFILVLAFLISLSFVVAEDNNTNQVDFSCNSDDDCILKVPSDIVNCPICLSCNSYYGNDTKVIAVNKNWPKCPEKKNYARGQLIVLFKENVSENEAISLINNYNLSWISGPFKFAPPSSSIYGTLNVSIDEEEKWIDILKNESIIKSAELNMITCPACIGFFDLRGYEAVCKNNKCIKVMTTKTNETEDDEEDCWKCSKWSVCINHTQIRTCTKIANCTDDEDDNETDDDEGEKPKIIKKCELKKKIKDYYINKECPEECTCTGSVIKCELASGRIMSVYAGKSGNVIIQIKGVNMSTNVTLYKNENGTLEGIFKGNKTRIIKVLPDEVREKLKEKIKSIIEDEEINLDDYGFYKIKAHKKARFLLIIPVRENIEGQVDSETGNIIIIKKGSWWGFLARDVKEED